jgi:hypothetical protein
VLSATKACNDGLASTSCGEGSDGSVA